MALRKTGMWKKALILRHGRPRGLPGHWAAAKAFLCRKHGRKNFIRALFRCSGPELDIVWRTVWISVIFVVNTLPGRTRRRIESSLRELREESVLELRGDEWRFAFDPFFSFCLWEHLVQLAKDESWSSANWWRVIERSHSSNYHRPGVASALSWAMGSDASREDRATLLLALLSEKRSEFPSFRQLLLDAMVEFGIRTPQLLAEALMVLLGTLDIPLVAAEAACRVLASPRVGRRQTATLVRVVGSVLGRRFPKSRRIRDRSAVEAIRCRICQCQSCHWERFV